LLPLSSYFAFISLPCFFFLYCYRDHLHLPSFPTRRSSDLSPCCRSAATSTCPAWRRRSPRTAGSSTRTRAWPRRAWARSSGSSSDRKSTRLNSSHVKISYAVFCLKKKKKKKRKRHNITDER